MPSVSGGETPRKSGRERGLRTPLRVSGAVDPMRTTAMPESVSGRNPEARSVKNPGTERVAGIGAATAIVLVRRPRSASIDPFSALPGARGISQTRVEGAPETEAADPPSISNTVACDCDMLAAHATPREFVYAHVWRLHDPVMWGNRATMHRGRPFDAAEVRDMRRTTLAGDAPSPPTRRSRTLSPPDLPAWFVAHLDSVQPAPTLRRLDPGEHAAIALAHTLAAGLLAIDDRAGVSAARERGFWVTGTLGVLVEAASQDLPELSSAFAALRRANFHHAPTLLDALLAQNHARREKR